MTAAGAATRQDKGNIIVGRHVCGRMYWSVAKQSIVCHCGNVGRKKRQSKCIVSEINASLQIPRRNNRKYVGETERRIGGHHLIVLRRERMKTVGDSRSPCHEKSTWLLLSFFFIRMRRSEEDGWIMDASLLPSNANSKCDGREKRFMVDCRGKICRERRRQRLRASQQFSINLCIATLFLSPNFPSKHFCPFPFLFFSLGSMPLPLVAAVTAGECDGTVLR